MFPSPSLASPNLGHDVRSPLTTDSRFSRGVEGLMIDVTHTVTIDRPVSEVFDFVTESSNEPKWDVDVQEVNRRRAR